MIAIIISTFGGLLGIIPPEHFWIWREIIAIEAALDLPVAFAVMIIRGYIINRRENKENRRENKKHREVSRWN